MLKRRAGASRRAPPLCGFALLGAEVEPVRGDELRLDADEIEDAAQVAFEMLERGCGRARVVTSATSQSDDHALAAGEAFGPFSV